MSMYTRKDAYYRQAKKDGYASRAAYKLSDLSKKYRILRAGNRVLDLGCAPGGWIQMASSIVGPGGIIAGVDLEEVKGFSGRPTIHLFRGNIGDESVIARAVEAVKGPCDVVLSDAAPHLTGIGPRDDAAMEDLVRTAWTAARSALRPGGHFLIKIFPSAGMDALIRDIRACFRESHLSKPDSSRRSSSEQYLICKGYTGGR